MARDRAPSINSRPALAGVRTAIVTFPAGRTRCRHGYAATVGDECGRCEEDGVPPSSPITTRLQVGAWRKADGTVVLSVLLLDKPDPRPTIEVKVPRGVNVTWQQE